MNELNDKQKEFENFINSPLSAQLFEVFSCGKDYGLLIAEEERLNHDLSKMREKPRPLGRGWIAQAM